MKNDKIIVISIIVLIICIIVILSILYVVRKNNLVDEDEIRKLPEGGQEYTREELNQFQLELIRIDSLKGKINEKKLLIEVKEYVYLNGLVQANRAECIQIQEQENGYNLTFQLNDPKQSVLQVKVNLKEDTYQVS